MRVLADRMGLAGRLRPGLLVAAGGVLCALSLAHAYRGEASPMAVAAQQHLTITLPKCSYAGFGDQMFAIRCGAYVTDQNATPTTPTGTVTFTASAGGFDGSPCTLSAVPYSSGSAFCAVDAVNVPSPGATVHASYSGDATHAHSGNELVTGSPSGAPQIINVTQSAASWRAGKGLPHTAKARPPVGTTFGFTVDRPARVQFVFTGAVIGRRVGGRCVAQTSANRHGALCLRTVSAAFSRQVDAGRTRLHFEGRVDRRRTLPPGRYKLIITATASGRRSKPAILRFTILPATSRSPAFTG